MPAPALLIVPYFGTFGPWFPLYLHSLSHQSTLDLLLVTDAPTPPLPSNVRRAEMTLADLRALATDKLGVPVALMDTRKLCDLKPAYGLVFEDYVSGYEYWGFGDEDVLYGDLDRLLAPRFRSSPDIVTAGEDAPVGHFTLVRNVARATDLVLDDPEYHEVLADPAHWAYDEWSWAKEPDCGSFTKTVRRAEGSGKIVVSWDLPRRGDVPWIGDSYTYRDGSIWNHKGEELAYYHWGRYRREGYEFPSPELAEEGFGFDRYGFYFLNEGSVQARIRKATGYARYAGETAGKGVRRIGEAVGRRVRRAFS